MCLEGECGARGLHGLEPVQYADVTLPLLFQVSAARLQSLQNLCPGFEGPRQLRASVARRPLLLGQLPPKGLSRLGLDTPGLSGTHLRWAAARRGERDGEKPFCLLQVSSYPATHWHMQRKISFRAARTTPRPNRPAPRSRLVRDDPPPPKRDRQPPAKVLLL